MRYRISISYDGSKYAGWQRQPNQPTVQQEIEKALTTYFGGNAIEVIGAGRTDSGVHARGQVAHFDTVKPTGEIKAFLRSMRGLLPNDIMISDIESVPDTFHARFDATSRSYSYYFSLKDDVFQNRYTWVVRSEPEIQTMRRLAEMLEGEHDFASFSKRNPDVANTRCTVLKSEIHEEGDGRYRYEIQANRFLHHMVRSIIGKLMQTGTGKISPDEFRSLLMAPSYLKFGFTAPAHALFLDRVKYE